MDEAPPLETFVDPAVWRFASEASAAGVSPSRTMPSMGDLDTLAALDIPRASALVTSHAAAALDTSKPGTLIGDLDLGATISRGPKGWVRKARQPSLDRTVAIKTVDPDHAGSASVEALLREALIAGRLDHPHIVPIHAIGNSERYGPFIVKKHVDGTPWGEWLSSQPRRAVHSERDLRDALGIFLAVCQAIEYAHSRRVVHRNIHPDHVMLGDFGEVYVTDWHEAMLVGEDGAEQRRAVVGRPEARAPEIEAPLAEATESSDVYMLGATLCYVLTGSWSHAEDHDERQGARLPQELAHIVATACARRSMRRYTGVSALREAVSGYLARLAAIETLRYARHKHDQLDERPADAARWPATRKALAEIRYAYQEVLRQWPESRAARQGLREIRIAQARLALDEGNVAGAHTVVEGLEDAPSGLLDRIAEAERLVSERDDALAELAEIRAAQELRGQRERSGLSLAVGLGNLVAGVGMGLLDRTGVLPLTPWVLASVTAIIGTIGVITRWHVRNTHILDSALYRKLWASFETLNWLSTGATLALAAVGMTMAQIWVVIGLLGTGIGVVMAMTVDRAFYSNALAGGFITFLIAFHPTYAPEFVGSGYFVASAVIAWRLRPGSKMRRRQESA